mmetsp:Transcript_5486/g.7790  ORF Transcript_5486/g.7790 Transcript_5486/m.7790 type:complete len:133 (-) Transcript_5486:109-507(-)
MLVVRPGTSSPGVDGSVPWSEGGDDASDLTLCFCGVDDTDSSPTTSSLRSEDAFPPPPYVDILTGNCRHSNQVPYFRFSSVSKKNELLSKTTRYHAVSVEHTILILPDKNHPSCGKTSNAVIVALELSWLSR